MIHAKKTRLFLDPNNLDQPEFYVNAEMLLNQGLSRILELDLKFRVFVDKCNIFERTFDNLREGSDVVDDMFEDTLPAVATIPEVSPLYLFIQAAIVRTSICAALTSRTSISS